MKPATDRSEYRLAKRHLLALVLTCLLAPPFAANASSTETPALTRDASDNESEANEQAIRRDLELFRNAPTSLLQAITSVQKLDSRLRIADVGFDGGSGQPVYRVKAFQKDRLLEYTVDASTGELSAHTIMSALKELSAEDRKNLMALKTVRQQLSDAVVVAERATSGKAISGGLMQERGKLNFVIVVVSGDSLKQVMLEPPRIRRR